MASSCLCRLDVVRRKRKEISLCCPEVVVNSIEQADSTISGAERIEVPVSHRQSHSDGIRQAKLELRISPLKGLCYLIHIKVVISDLLLIDSVCKELFYFLYLGVL